MPWFMMMVIMIKSCHHSSKEPSLEINLVEHSPPQVHVATCLQIVDHGDDYNWLHQTIWVDLWSASFGSDLDNFLIRIDHRVTPSGSAPDLGQSQESPPPLLMRWQILCLKWPLPRRKIIVNIFVRKTSLECEIALLIRVIVLVSLVFIHFKIG